MNKNDLCAHPMLRIGSGFLAVIFLLFGIGNILEAFKDGRFVFDGNCKFGISATVIGVIFLWTALFGRLEKKKCD